MKEKTPYQLASINFDGENRSLYPLHYLSGKKKKVFERGKRFLAEKKQGREK